MKAEEEFESITKICRRTGVSEDQAKLMAQRLIKRSYQLAEQRDISRIEAMQYLLSLLLKGING